MLSRLVHVSKSVSQRTLPSPLFAMSAAGHIRHWSPSAAPQHRPAAAPVVPTAAAVSSPLANMSANETAALLAARQALHTYAHHHERGDTVEFPVPGVETLALTNNASEVMPLSPVLMVRASGPALILGHVHVRTKHASWSGRARAYPPGTLVLRSLGGASPLAVEQSNLTVSFNFEVGGEYLIEATLLFSHFDRSKVNPSICPSADPSRPLFLARYYHSPSTFYSSPSENGVGGAHKQAGPGWFATPPSPAFTRMQIGCKRPTPIPGDHPKPVKDDLTPLLHRYMPGGQYQLRGVKHAINNYVWGTYNLQKKLIEPTPFLRQHIENLCVLGGSHARDLAAEFPGALWIAARFAGESLFDKREPNGRERVRLGDPSTISGWSGKGLPDYPQPNFNLSSCSALLLHYGQWDAGFPCRLCNTPSDIEHATERNCLPKPPPPSSHHNCPPRFDVYEADMSDRLLELKSAGLLDRVVMTTTNANGLSCLTSACPMVDWRIPPVTDIINEIMKRAAAKHKVPFIDNDDIVRPMWDSSVDLCHASGDVKAALVTRWTEVLCERLKLPACIGPKLARIRWPDHPPPAQWW